MIGIQYSLNSAIRLAEEARPYSRIRPKADDWG